MGKKTRQARERLKSGNFKLPSPKEVRDAMTSAGAWTARQLAEWGVDWPPPKGWRRELHLQWEALNGPPKVEIPETSGNDPRQIVIGNPPYQFILTPLADGEISIMTHHGEGGHFDEDDFSEWVAEFVATRM